MFKIRKCIDEFKYENYIDKFSSEDVSQHILSNKEVKFDKKYADFHEIDKLIEVFYLDYSEKAPKAFKNILMVVVSLAMMLLVSWHLSLVCIGSIVFLIVLKYSSDTLISGRRDNE